MTNLLVETGLSAVEREVAVLIHIDEVQNITSEETLSPLRWYLIGLPDFADMAGAKKGATFARRFATTTLQRDGRAWTPGAPTHVLQTRSHATQWRAIGA